MATASLNHADPVVGVAIHRLLSTASTIRGSDAIAEARARVDTFDAEAQRLAPYLAHPPGDRQVWPLEGMRAAIASRFEAAGEATALEALAAGKEPDLSPAPDAARKIAVEILERFAGGRRFSNLAWLVNQAQRLRTAAAAELADVDAKVAKLTASYETARDHLRFARLREMLLPILHHQLELEGTMALLRVLDGLPPAIAAAIAGPLAAAGSTDQLAVGVKEAIALGRGKAGPDPATVALTAQRADVASQIETLTSHGATGGAVHSELTARQADLDKQLADRAAARLEVPEQKARDLVAKVAAGDIRQWAELCGLVAASPAAFPTDFLGGLVEAVATAMEQGDAEAFCAVLEGVTSDPRDLAKADAEVRRRLGAAAVARGLLAADPSTPAAAPVPSAPATPTATVAP
jgi:hypothetical protein